MTVKDVCVPCNMEDHVTCIERDDRDCPCNCRGWTDCDTCGETVILWADDPDDTTYAHGECCTWAYIDTFEGSIRLDLREEA